MHRDAGPLEEVLAGQRGLHEHQHAARRAGEHEVGSGVGRGHGAPCDQGTGRGDADGPERQAHEEQAAQPVEQVEVRLHLVAVAVDDADRRRGRRSRRTRGTAPPRSPATATSATPEATSHHDRELGDDGGPPQPGVRSRSCQWAASAHSPTAALVADDHPREVGVDLAQRHGAEPPVPRRRGASRSAGLAPMIDLVVRNGQLVDGSGAPGPPSRRRRRRRPDRRGRAGRRGAHGVRPPGRRRRRPARHPGLGRRPHPLRRPGHAGTRG